MNCQKLLTSIRRLVVCLVACLTCIPVASSQDRAPDGTDDIPKLEFEKYSLPNGLQVILHVDRKLPMVHVNSWYHVGSKNERLGRTGFAHLFEHMMFEGSKDANKKYISLIEKAGANLFEGGVNGTTNEDRTNYFETVPSGSLEYVLWLESDRLATLTDVLTKAKLDSEREIVKNERRQRLENQPYGRAFSLISENVFPNGHPYQHSVIGSHEDLNAASVEDVADFFHRYYTPSNLSLAITGDFNPAEAKRLIEKYYGPIAPGPALDRPKLWVPDLKEEKIIEVKDHVPLERTYFAWPSPAYFDVGDAQLDLASLILTDGIASRLQKSLVYDKQLCSDIQSFQGSSEMAGIFVIWATAKPGKSLASIEESVTSDIAKLAQDGPSSDELSRAKAKWEFQYVTGLERIGGFGGQADVLNQYNTFLGDPDHFADDVARHRNATAASVKEAAAKWLSGTNRLLVRFHPDLATSLANASLDRSKQPELGADRPFQVPEVKSTSLENGLKVFVAQRKDLPKVFVTVAAQAGSAADPSGKEGLASLTLEAMKRGSQTHTALELDNLFGDLGASLNGDADREYSDLNIEVLRRNLGPALALLADVSQRPSFPPEEVAREKSKRLDLLSQQESDPGTIARRVRQMLAFGHDHPYGHPVSGYRSTVEKFTTEDLTRFHSARWKPGSSTIVFAGDISLDQAVALAKQYFGSWPAGAAPALSIPPPEPIGPGKLYLVDRPDAAQTVISEILPSPLRGASDYYSFELADAVWGGAAGARLGMNLREDKGYSYGVFSASSFYSKAGTWTASGGVQTDKTTESVVEFEKELHNLAGQKQVSAAELTAAKNIRIRGYAQQFESLSRLSGQIVDLWSLGLPLSDMQREGAELDQQTLESVNATAEKYANPDRATMLLVGDASKIETGVRNLKVHQLVHLDVEGRPVKADNK